MILRIYSIVSCFFIFQTALFAQNPSFFQITEEEGLPINKIYNITKDTNGFVWIGSEAGLFRFDGIRFHGFTNKFQKSKSVTGLTVSSSGRIYCYNFKGQIFYHDNDSLHLLIERKNFISNITSDNKYNIWFTDKQGIYCYNEKSKKWTSPDIAKSKFDSDDIRYAKNCYVDSIGNVHFTANKGVFELTNNLLLNTSVDFTSSSTKIIGNYQLCIAGKTKWLIPLTTGFVYKLENNKFEIYKNVELTKNLEGRKITHTKFLSDGNIWIPTYSGIIIFNPVTENVRLLFPGIAFTDCMIDNEGNYWFSSLYNGLYRISNLDFLVWNLPTQNNLIQKVIKVCASKTNIFIATSDGKVGYLNEKKLKYFDNEIIGDIQALLFDSIDNSLFYIINNNIYKLKDEKIEKINSNIPPIKDFKKIENNFIIATSIGTFIYNRLNDDRYSAKLTQEWSREIFYNQNNKQLWIATNSGIMLYIIQNEQKWKFFQTFLTGIQIISIAYDTENKSIYAITFDGELYEIQSNLRLKKFEHLPTGILCQQLKYFDNNLYVATNKGLFIFNLLTKTWLNLDKFVGIASDNIYSIDILSDFIWLATNKGVQQIPLKIKSNPVFPKIFLKELFINHQSVKKDFLQINYNQTLDVHVEALSYTSINKFKYAYRFMNADSTWNFFPAEMEIIPITSIPTGNFKIEICAFDYLNRISQNKIILNGYKSPPFWQQWWFYLAIGLLALWISTVGFLRRVRQMKKRQTNELEKIKLENEINLSQLTALKAQMNPHFIFNVLNSIKGYIYENDKKYALQYLNSFSDLIRKILEMSSKNLVTLNEEIEIDKLYIELECMLLDEEFEFILDVDEKIDLHRTEIPALLIQPFIENAFKHGLRHKKGKKKLSISFEKSTDNNWLYITISDNGIGFQASQKINERNTNKHTSFATSAIEKRLELLNLGKKNFISIEYRNNTISDKLPEGTSVKIKILIND